MNINPGARTLVRYKTTNKYPVVSLLVALALLYIAPFVSSLLPYAAFAIFIYRVVRYDARVFAADYCVLLPIARLFSTPGGLTLLIWLCLFAAVWYMILRGVRADATYIFLLAILNYLILRMQLEISSFVLCFGQMYVLCVLLPLQDEESSARAAKVFCIGLIVSSVYALILRNTWQIEAIRGKESEAIWGSGIWRFTGLIKDPNYYATMIIMGLVALVKLKECQRVSKLLFWIMAVALTLFGAISYSKTFLVVFVLLGGIYILWHFRNRKIFTGIFMVVVVIIAASFLLFSEKSPFAVIVERLSTSRNLNVLTTGRMAIYAAYWKAITENATVFLFGRGLAAELLCKPTHNIYLEILYHIGFVGFILFAGFYISIMRVVLKSDSRIRRQHFIAKYVGLFMMFVLYIPLNGMFQNVTYGDFFLAFLTLMILKKQPASDSTEVEEAVA